jgi:hypothetical protein
MDYLRVDVIKLPLKNILATGCDADVLYMDSLSRALVITSTQLY